MASSLPAAIDYLVSAIRSLEVVGPHVVVSDGWPSARGDDMIVIGVTPDEGDSTVSGAYSGLSNGGEEETVELTGIIVVHRGGASAKRPRDVAFALFDGIREMIRADRRLGGAVSPGMPARLTGWTVSQTSEAAQAGEGRVCSIEWTLSWVHRT